MKRRGFLSAILMAGMAPAVVKSGVIMQINPRQGIWLPPGKAGQILQMQGGSAVWANADAHRELGELMAQHLQQTMKRPSFMGAWRKVHGNDWIIRA